MASTGNLNIWICSPHMMYWVVVLLFRWSFHSPDLPQFSLLLIVSQHWSWLLITIYPYTYPVLLFIFPFKDTKKPNLSWVYITQQGRRCRLMEEGALGEMLQGSFLCRKKNVWQRLIWKPNIAFIERIQYSLELSSCACIWDPCYDFQCLFIRSLSCSEFSLMVLQLHYTLLLIHRPCDKCQSLCALPGSAGSRGEKAARIWLGRTLSRECRLNKVAHKGLVTSRTSWAGIQTYRAPK